MSSKLSIFIINIGLVYIAGWVPLTWIMEVLNIIGFLDSNLVWTSFIFDIVNQAVYSLIMPLIF
jgi:hypothetical protein